MNENEIVETNAQTQNTNSKKNSTLPLLVIALLLVGVGGYLYLNVFNKNTPKKMFISSIEKAFSKASNIKTKDFNTLSDEFNINVKVSSPLLDNDLLNLINKIDLSGKLELDKKNNELYTKIVSKYDNLDLLKFSAYMKDDAFYMMLDDILDKWIKIDLDNENIKLDLTKQNFNATNIDLKKYEKLTEEIEKALENSLKDEYFKKEKTDGGNKITLTIDDSNVKDILTSLLKELKKSKEFKEFYKEMSGSNTFDDDMDLIITSLKSVEIPKDSFKVLFNVYTNSKGEFKKLDITVTSGTEDFSIVLEQTSDDTLEFALKTKGVRMFSGSITAKEEDGKATFKLSLSMMEMINFELNIEEKIKYDIKLDKVDLDNSVTSDKLTEKDLEKLEKLENSEGIKKFLEDLEKINLEDMMNGFGLDNSNALSF